MHTIKFFDFKILFTRFTAGYYPGEQFKLFELIVWETDVDATVWLLIFTVGKISLEIVFDPYD